MKMEGHLMKGLALIIIFAISLSYASFGQQSSCDYKVEILADGEEFEKEDFEWRMKATKIEGIPTNITGTAEIKADGRTAKSYKPWTSASISRQKTSSKYSPNLNPGNYELTAEISVECDDANKGNNVDTKKIKIKGEVEEKTAKKSKNEEDVTGKSIQSEEKQQIASNSQNTITASDRNIVSGELKNQGFLSKAEKSATDEGVDNTIQLKTQNPQKRASQPITANIAESTKNAETIYVSSNEKAKGLIMVFLLTLSVLLNIILIWKR